MVEKGNLSPFSRVDADGKPNFGSKRSFEEACHLFEADTMHACLEKLKPQIDEIKALFLAGDKKELLEILARTGPASYKANEYSLGDAQTLNEFASSALHRLLDGPDVEQQLRPLTYQYQSHLGQDSGDVVMDRYFSLAGLNGEGAQKSASAELIRKNPTQELLKNRHDEALARLRAVIK